jgi:hypothetical protein
MQRQGRAATKAVAAWLVLVLTAQAGTLRWMNNYQYEGGWHSREELHHGIVCRDGNYAGCGYVGYRNTSMSQEMLLIRVDTAGNELWHRFYDNDERAKYAEAVLETPDGGFVLTGSKTVSDDTTLAVVLRTDSAGDEMWSSGFFSYESPRAFGHDIVPSGDGGWTICGKVGSG